HLSEGAILLAPLDEIQVRGAVLRDSFRQLLLKHDHQLIRIRIRQRLQKHCVYHAENRCISADAERERKHRYGGKCWILPQHSECVPKVLEECLNPGQTLEFAMGLTELGDSS